MSAFKKKTFLSKLILKSKDYEEYKNYQFLYKLSKLPQPVNLAVPFKEEYHFKHSGNAGDIIYSLPAAYALAGTGRIHYHFNLGAKGHYGKKPHPLGNVMLTEKIVQLLQPLLLSQPSITECSIYTPSQPIDFDLDLVRTYPFPLNRGNIARWYFYVFAINANLSNPWLHVTPNTDFKDHMVIARSQRYQAPAIDYSFLKKYRNIVFIGVEAELKEMRQMLPHIAYQPVADFLEMAQIIAGSKLFIGNQSFPFSIAEALKVKRLLEVYHLCPNVNVEGDNGFDFCFQPQFEKLVEKLYEEN